MCVYIYIYIYIYIFRLIRQNKVVTMFTTIGTFKMLYILWAKYVFAGFTA